MMQGQGAASPLKPEKVAVKKNTRKTPYVRGPYKTRRVASNVVLSNTLPREETSGTVAPRSEASDSDVKGKSAACAGAVPSDSALTPVVTPGVSLSMSPASQAPAPVPDVSGENVRLKVSDQEGRRLAFNIKTHTPLGRLFDLFCARTSVRRRDVHFVINDGEIIHPEATPESLGLGNNDVIECAMCAE